MREIPNQPPYQRDSGIGIVMYREENFIFRISLPAETREILIGTEINTTHRLEHARGRRKLGNFFRALTPEKTQRRKRRSGGIAERRGGQQQRGVLQPLPEGGPRRHTLRCSLFSAVSCDDGQAG